MLEEQVSVDIAGACRSDASHRPRGVCGAGARAATATSPTASDIDHFGESGFDNALPWTKIKSANYTFVGDMSSVLPLL
jgi:hypothetical protein